MSLPALFLGGAQLGAGDGAPRAKTPRSAAAKDEAAQFVQNLLLELPPELVDNVSALLTDCKSVANWCRVSKATRSRCMNDNFWKQLCETLFGEKLGNDPSLPHTAEDHQWLHPTQEGLLWRDEFIFRCGAEEEVDQTQQRVGWWNEAAKTFVFVAAPDWRSPKGAWARAKIVVLPKGTLKVEQSFFAMSTTLRCVLNMEDATEIGANAFKGCTALALTALPGLTKIGSGI